MPHSVILHLYFSHFMLDIEPCVGASSYSYCSFFSPFSGVSVYPSSVFLQKLGAKFNRTLFKTVFIH